MVKRKGFIRAVKILDRVHSYGERDKKFSLVMWYRKDFIGAVKVPGRFHSFGKAEKTFFLHNVVKEKDFYLFIRAKVPDRFNFCGKGEKKFAFTVRYRKDFIHAGKVPDRFHSSGERENCFFVRVFTAEMTDSASVFISAVRSIQAIN